MKPTGNIILLRPPGDPPQELLHPSVMTTILHTIDRLCPFLNLICLGHIEGLSGPWLLSVNIMPMRFIHVVGVLTSRPVLLKVGSSQVILRVPLIFQLEKSKWGCLTVQKGVESIPLQGTQSCPGPSLYSLEPEQSHSRLPDCSFLRHPARPGP